MPRYPLSEAYVRERLVPYRVCNRCGNHVLTSELDEYAYQCLYCDEDLYSIETHELEEKTEISNFDFYDLVEQVHHLMFSEEEDLWV